MIIIERLFLEMMTTSYEREMMRKGKIGRYRGGKYRLYQKILFMKVGRDVKVA